MGDIEATGGTSIGSIVVAALFGYFVYNRTIAGALGAGLLCFILELSVLIAMVPFAGVFIQGFLDITWLIPSILSMTGLWDTWLVTLMLVIALIVGAIVTIVTSLMVLGRLD